MTNTITLLTIAFTIFGESEGEGLMGKKAVASAIYNRAKPNNTPIEKVCLAPKQFSFWNNMSFNDVRNVVNKKIVNPLSYNSWMDCLKIAKDLATNKFQPIHDFKNYHAKNMTPKTWELDPKTKITIGNHVFGRAIKKQPIMAPATISTNIPVNKPSGIAARKQVRRESLDLA